MTSLTGQLTRGRVAVVGDLMLDHHVHGAVDRLSAEAPVPVLHVRAERYALGGAANVAANVAALGGTAELIGLIGADAAAGHMVRLVDEWGARLRLHAQVDPLRPTIVKTRYLGGQHQIVRVDRELVAPAPPRTEDALIEDLQAAIAHCGVVVASDYGKGVLSDRLIAAVFEGARAHGRTSIVDPKRRTFTDYRGASYVTPNRKELSLATGLPCESDAEADAAAAEAIAQCGAAILLTRSEKGMSLHRDGQPTLRLSAEAREVFDVSGAGDTVVAAMALALAAGIAPGEAMRIANAAAGVVVGKLGTATVSPEELAAALAVREARPLRLEAGVTPLAEAVAQRQRWRAQGLSVGFANGCFDLLHPGHVSLISQAAAACDRLIVALNDDASVARLKGPTRPIQPLPARAQVIGAIKGVDLVIGFAEDTPLDAIVALEPDVLVKGADYREDQVVGADVVKARGGRVLLAQLVDGQSTSGIVARSKP